MQQHYLPLAGSVEPLLRDAPWGVEFPYGAATGTSFESRPEEKKPISINHLLTLMYTWHVWCLNDRTLSFHLLRTGIEGNLLNGRAEEDLK
jgi:hypothetical protein